MKSKSIRLAKMVSVIGHPLIFGSTYVAVMSFLNLPEKQAWYITIAVVFVLIIPITIHNWRKTRSGAYTNFDVSDQNQRKGFYPIAIGLLLLLILTFWTMNVPNEVIHHTLLILGMVGLMAVFNKKIKASVHTAIAIFIAINCFSLGAFTGIGLLFFAAVIAWSRCELGRHTLIEICVGSAFGLVFGTLALLT